MSSRLLILTQHGQDARNSFFIPTHNIHEWIEYYSWDQRCWSDAIWGPCTDPRFVHDRCEWIFGVGKRRDAENEAPAAAWLRATPYYVTFEDAAREHCGPARRARGETQMVLRAHSGLHTDTELSRSHKGSSHDKQSFKHIPEAFEGAPLRIGPRPGGLSPSQARSSHRPQRRITARRSTRRSTLRSFTITATRSRTAGRPSRASAIPPNLTATTASSKKPRCRESM
jgi:hypothetical protein